ncbi:hypothetical protein F0562_022756 [Nyssa sinensis]|uniref:Uncharacterized protein n=1 Tax=Nyssa sinensis TaxID=561372 RepID=A0A5J5BFX0_9ASTE|nr:hypothetical protein F0562_022756 [Nyssa sinensis]
MQFSRESTIDQDNGQESNGTVEKEKKEESMEGTKSSQNAQSTRRLSVQDRINLFESKQKKSSDSGGKPIVGKVAELRRLSSDISSAPAVFEKAVLRRWSGASDMSIDLSGEKKEIESPLCTPSASSVSQTNFDDQKGINDTAASAKPELKNVTIRVGDSGLKDHADSQACVGFISSRDEVAGTKVGISSETQLTVSSGRSDSASKSNKLVYTLGRVEGDGWKDQTRGKAQSRSSFSGAEDNCLKDEATSQTQFRSFSGGRAEQFSLTDRGKFRSSLGGDEGGGTKELIVSEMQIGGLKDSPSPQTQFGALASRRSDVRLASESYQLPQGEIPNRVEDVRLSNESVTQSRFRAPLRTTVDSGHLEGFSGLKTCETSVAQYKEADSKLAASQPQWRYLGEIEEVGKKDLVSSEMQLDSSVTKLENSGPQRMKFQKHISDPEQIKKSQGRRNDSISVYGSSKTLFSVKMVSESPENIGSTPMAPVEVEQVQRVRQSKGNQELNDELKMKANELEKIFAEHKLRVPGDQSNSTQRSKTADMLIGQTESLPHRKPVAEVASAQFPDKNTIVDPAGNSSNSFKFSSSSQDENGRQPGLWPSFQGLQIAMIQYLVHVDVQKDSDPLILRSSMKREQLPLDFIQSEDDDDLSEFPEQKPLGHNRSFSATSSGDGASRSTQNRKLLPNRNLFSSTPHISATPVPRSAVKASNSSSGRRRMQYENPLALSVANFSDLRKENTKPSSGVNKTTVRPKLRSFARGKSTSEEEFRDMSPLKSEGIILTPLKFDKERTEQNLSNKFSKNVDSKPFLRKGSGIGPNGGAGIAKLKAVVPSDTMNHEEEPDELAFGPEDSVHVVKDEEEGEFETMTTEDHANVDNGKPRMSQESDKLVNSRSENGNALRSFSQMDYSLEATLPAAVPSTFHLIGSVQDSPGESPVSWNSCMRHPFSYPHETSDIDASADSPMGSPTSWNSHSLNQTEADEARMRKKWGSAQKPILVANSSHIQSHKDVTKGFKRLLKFGRKTSGTESLVDWISATTSEGDDDTEDGRDPANRSSEDLRKSRMGFSLGHPSDDSFNESDFFGEQVQALHSSIPAPPANFKLREDHLSGSTIKAPRSFFSLSSFRSKGSDSKPR